MSFLTKLFGTTSQRELKSIYPIVDKVEALEFLIREKTSYTGIPLRDLPIRENHLVACIVRGRQIIIPGGNDTLEVGDSVIVICKGRMMEDLKDILA